MKQNLNKCDNPHEANFYTYIISFQICLQTSILKQMPNLEVLNLRYTKPLVL